MDESKNTDKQEEEVFTPGEYLAYPVEHHEKKLHEWIKRWIYQICENWAGIKNESKAINYCLTNHKKQKGPAIIIGSGPSLDESLRKLKQWKHPIFCSPSNASTLWYHERPPEYINAYDAERDYVYLQLRDIPATKKMNTVLLAHPAIDPKVIEFWLWRKFYYRMIQKGINFFEQWYQVMYPWIKIGFYDFGSTANNSVQIASFLGFDPIILVGLDLGFPGGWNRYTARKWHRGNSEWMTVRSKKLKEEDLYLRQKIHRSDNGVLTTEEFIAYKQGLFLVQAGDAMNLIQVVSKRQEMHGIITELPEMTIDEVIKAQEDPKLFEPHLKEKDEIRDISRRYLQDHAVVQQPAETDRGGNGEGDWIEQREE